MAGELCLKHTASGATIRAAILDVDRARQWDGTAMVAVSALTDAQWVAGLIACAEQQTADATPTARYVGDLPASLAATGEEYVVEFYAGAAPTPGQRIAGIQSLSPKIGYKLASDGLDAIADEEVVGPATTLPQRINQLWRRLFGKAVLDKTTGTLTTYAADGVTPLTEQAVAETDTTQTIEAAAAPPAP